MSNDDGQCSHHCYHVGMHSSGEGRETDKNDKNQNRLLLESVERTYLDSFFRQLLSVALHTQQMRLVPRNVRPKPPTITR